MGHRVVQQRHRAGGIVVQDGHRRGVVETHRRAQYHGVRHQGVGIKDADVIGARRQRRPDGNRIAQAGRRHEDRDVQRDICNVIRQGRVGTQLHRQRQVGRRTGSFINGIHREVGIAHRHDHIGVIPALGLDEVRDATIGQILMILKEQAAADAADEGGRVVRRVQVPDALALLLDILVQGTGPGGRLRICDVVPAAVVKNLGVDAWGIGGKVGHQIHHAAAGRRRGMAQRDGQVAVILRGNLIGGHDAVQLNRIDGHADGVNVAGLVRVAVGNVHLGKRHRLVAIGILLAERDVAELRQEGVFRRHLVLGLHADIINFRCRRGRGRRRIGIHDEFRAAPGQSRAVEKTAGCRAKLRAAHAVGNHYGIQIRQTGIRGNKQINVRLRQRAVGVRAGEHALARNRQRGRQEHGEDGVGVVRRRAGVGDDVEMPLVRLADGQQRVGDIRIRRAGGKENGVGGHHRRARPDRLVHQRCIGADHHGDALVAGGIGRRRICRDRKPVGVGAVAAGDDERKILRDVRRIVAGRIVRLRGDGVHIHGGAGDDDGEVGAGIRRQEDILHIVDAVHPHRRVGGVLRRVVILVGLDVVAEIDHGVGQVVRVGDGETQAVDQLEGGGGVAGRIGPRQRDAQRLRLRGGREGNRVGPGVAGGQRVGRVLVHKEDRVVGDDAVGERRADGVGQVDETPAFIVDGVVDLKIVIAGLPRAVDEHGLEQRRAGQGLQRVGEVILHQRQHAGNVRRRHARAALVAVVFGHRAEVVVHVLKLRVIIPQGVGRDQRHLHVIGHRHVRWIADAEIEVAGMAENLREIARRHGQDVVAGGILIVSRIGIIGRRKINRHVRHVRIRV